MPFDVMAETYDKDFSHSYIGKLQREKVWSYLLPVLKAAKKPLNILELNCGTGEDALRLAALGHNVIATDASEVMIQKAQNKLHINQNKSLQFVQCSFQNISSLAYDEKFDLVFSNFGGLNCIDKNALKKLEIDLSKITSNNAQLFFVIMGKFCLWETTYYLFKARCKAAFRRLSNKTTFTVNGNEMPIYYYSPEFFKKEFKGYNFISRYPVGLFLPPSYLESFFCKRLSLLNKLNVLEKVFFNLKWMSNLSDHYCVILKRRGS